MFKNINFQLPNTHKREEICIRLALDLIFYMEEKKVEPENIFPAFPASFCSKVYYFLVFPENFLKTGIFPVFPSRVDTLISILWVKHAETYRCFEEKRIFRKSEFWP